MTDEHRTPDGPAPRRISRDEERRRARSTLAGRARDAGELSLLLDMLDLDPGHDGYPEEDGSAASPDDGRPP
ncbi:hypothetical protein [Streptomyces catenulae]|uniref:Uncharacterized protein n=1 Tax=Streptomyces catenulae TaxID=66875 RepID=A0ABV2Z764_9ACTN|nr:hypothetical protein [Streptomyces catenulae]